MNTITINGETITTYGNNVVVRNGKVTVDGEVIKEFTGNPTVIINGSVNNIECSGSVEVNQGIVYKNIDCCGSCTVHGDVRGNIDAGGSVHCENVYGDIDAGGSVNCKKGYF